VVGDLLELYKAAKEIQTLNLCSKLVIGTYRGTLFFNTKNIHYLTICTETTTNDTFYYLSRQKRTTEVDAIYLNKRAIKCHRYSRWQLNVGIKKVTFVFYLPYSLAVHICCHCQCHKCTLHTMSKVCIHETGYLLLASVLKPGVNLPEDSCTHF